ncbi:MAG: PAS domain S-box protein, partial [Desulfobacteraceae bacterium]
DGDHRITYWNKACEDLTGYSSEKMRGTDHQWQPFYPHKRPLLADLIMERDIDTTRRLYEEMKLRESTTVHGAYEAEAYFPQLGEDGRHLYFSAAPIADDTGAIQGAIETFVDFSERVRVTRQLRRREAFVQNLVENSIDGILATDFEGKIVIFNAAISDMLGYSPEEIIGRMRYTQILSRETTKNIRNAFYTNAYGPKGKIIDMQVDVINKEGEPMPVRISGTLLYQKREEVGSVVFIQDLREILRLQKEKEQAERMAAIGQTVAGLAHYIKNILNGLKGGAYVINSAMRKNDTKLIGSGWRMVEKNIDQITNIVMDMLVYSKERKPQHQEVDPSALVMDVLELMKDRAEVSGVSLVHDLDPELGTVSIERTGIHRCLLNLVSNAIDACTLEGIMEGKGVVTVKTDKPAGWAVRFQVIDNGTGITEETKEKLFTGFFSTKGYKGTGLGLPVTQKIVKEHNGELSFESEEGEGTKFTLLLPEK